MDRIIRLSDGTEYPAKMCGVSEGVLWVSVATTIADACAVFSDPERLATITDTYRGHEDLRSVTHEGFTSLVSLNSYTGDGYIQIGLRKGETA